MPDFKFRPKDFIALVTLVGIFGLKLAGIDGALDTTAALILGYYFVKRESKIDNGL